MKLLRADRTILKYETDDLSKLYKFLQVLK
jgi:hypothetical protein